LRTSGNGVSSNKAASILISSMICWAASLVKLLLLIASWALSKRPLGAFGSSWYLTTERPGWIQCSFRTKFWVHTCEARKNVTDLETASWIIWRACGKSNWAAVAVMFLSVEEHNMWRNELSMHSFSQSRHLALGCFFDHTINFGNKGHPGIIG
jgi:hypothetical protein